MDIAESDLMGAAQCMAEASRLGLLAELALHTEPVSAEELVEGTTIRSDRILPLLRVLEAMGVVSSCERGWRCSRAWQSIDTKWPAGIRGMAEIWEQLGPYLTGADGPLKSRESAENHYIPVASRMHLLYEERASLLADEVSLFDTMTGAPPILDVGCGSGVWSSSISAKLSRSRVLLDLPAVVATAPKGAKRIGADCASLPIADHSVGVFVAANILHCLDQEEMRIALNEAARVIASGGFVVLVDSFLADSGPATLHQALYDCNLRVRGGRLPSELDVDLSIPDDWALRSRFRLDEIGFLTALIYQSG